MERDIYERTYKGKLTVILNTTKERGEMLLKEFDYPYNIVEDEFELIIEIYPQALKILDALCNEYGIPYTY